jgi:1-acyl-sn-glycerol-3-phosphate acyltransferase
LSDQFRYLRLIYRLPGLLLHTLLGTPATVIAHAAPVRSIRIGGRCLSEIMLNWWAGTSCRLFGIRRQVRGRMTGGPLLIAANHISWIDILLLHSLAAMGFVSKAEIAQWPVIGFLARVGGTVFHRRGSHDSASGVAAAMRERLAEGGRVAVFPEGGVLPGDGVKRFHARLFGPAIDLAAPVQPVMLRYSRGGRPYPEITFLPGEPFLANFFRLLTQAPCLAEVHLLPRIEAAGRQRREVAAEAEAAVRAAFGGEVADG